MNPTSVYVHMLGDSTLDNTYWMLKEKNKSSIEDVKSRSIEGLLETILKDEKNASLSYKVMNHAYHDTATESILKGKSLLGLNKTSYYQLRNLDQNSKTVYPLNELKDGIRNKENETHYVVLGVGGNDLYECFSGRDLLAFTRIFKNRSQYFAIYNELKKLTLENKNIKLILMLPSLPSSHSEIYSVLKVSAVAGILGGLASFVFLTLALKISIIAMGLIFITFVRMVSPLFANINGKTIGDRIGITFLTFLFENFYRPILNQAREDAIPILDLANTFTHYNHRLYCRDLGPSQEGGELIARGISHIVKRHDFYSSSKLYAMNSSQGEFKATDNIPGAWRVKVKAPVPQTPREAVTKEAQAQLS